ncbi:MAG: division/cell wall cluster transcriptional repressor MraZ [Treponema sp.]|jgi:MraZ protein|nr:division/cell wall cluster transcriptional repressor MraZ [Treponema sp.]
MNLLTGEQRATLDEKNRINLPSRLRSAMETETVWVTKGNEKCIWVFPPEAWNSFVESIKNSPNLDMEMLEWAQFRFITPATEAEVDKAGRIALPQNVRDHALLSKDCMICGMGQRLAIWAQDQYEAYYKEHEAMTPLVVKAIGHISF